MCTFFACFVFGGPLEKYTLNLIMSTFYIFLMSANELYDDDDELMLNVLRYHLTY